MLIRKYLVSTLFLVLISSASSASVITVGQTGKYDYQTIQEAVDASVDGDEIIVAPGVYTSSTSWQPVVDIYNKNIWLHSSEGPDTTIIDGGQNKRGVQLYYGESNIEGFMIQNGSAIYSSGGGMRLYYANPTITDCIFENNNAGGSGYRGMYTYGGGCNLK